jgi:hypothetical protein
MENAHPELAKEMFERSQTPNLLQMYIEDNNLRRKRAG